MLQKKVNDIINVPLMLASEIFVDDLSQLVERYIEAKSEKSKRDDTSPFHSNKIPEIKLNAYFKRMNQYLLSEYDDSEKVTLWICAIILLTRYRDTTKTPLDWNNIYRLVAISMLLACKTIMDTGVQNCLAAKVFGITLKECNILEKSYLNSIQFSCEIKENDYASFVEYFKIVAISRSPNLIKEEVEIPKFEIELEESKAQREDDLISSLTNDFQKKLCINQVPLTFSIANQKESIPKSQVSQFKTRNSNFPAGLIKP